MSETVKKNICPVCGKEGIEVKKLTVKSLVNEEEQNNVIGDTYNICTDADCDIVYFNVENGEIYSKNQVSVPIWFKKNANPKYACYCSKVTEAEVIDAVKNHGAKTVADVNHITGAMKDANCKENNPLGVCCHHIIQDIIDRNID